jgi:hypothetical protein
MVEAPGYWTGYEWMSRISRFQRVFVKKCVAMSKRCPTPTPGLESSSVVALYDQ